MLPADGTDIWVQADAFYYRFKPLSGDGRLTVCVGNIAGRGKNEWRKAGVMICETLDVESPRAFMLTSAGGGGEAFRWRLHRGGTSQTLNSATFERACPTDFLVADLFRDGMVNFADYAVFMTQWLDEKL